MREGQPGARGAERCGRDGTASRRRVVLSRRQFLAGAVGAAGGATLGGHWGQVSHATSKEREVVHAYGVSDVSNVYSAMYIVAHEDDSLLFQSPSLLQNIQSNTCVCTVHLTAGDNGLGESYWSDREVGMEAAYAQMAGVADSWTASSLTIGSHQIVLDTLTAQPNITLVFMRLPDGNSGNGTGTAMYDYQSLMQLWQGTESTITAVDGSTSYDLQDLINTLAAMMNSFQPQLIATQDFVNTFGDGDHMDHYATADLALAAHKLFTSPHNFVGYEGYPVSSLAANVSGDLLFTKQAVFYTYGGFDENACSSADSCSSTTYATWLERQYTVGSEPVGVVANAGFAQTVDPGVIVQLDASMSSEGNGDPLTYAWTQTAGSAVTLSSTTIVNPTFTAPTGPATLTFSLTVSNGSETSTPSTVTITVAAGSGADTNVALLATATASSQNPSTGQLASSAIDGVISGYPNDNTAEWATEGGGVGSWLRLTWAESYTIDHVVLYDRPNLADQVTSGTLTFSDGTVVSFGELPNDGTTGLTVTLPSAITTTALLMTVTGVSSTTLNIGLSEIEAWGVSGLDAVRRGHTDRVGWRRSVGGVGCGGDVERFGELRPERRPTDLCVDSDRRFSGDVVEHNHCEPDLHCSDGTGDAYILADGVQRLRDEHTVYRDDHGCRRLGC